MSAYSMDQVWQPVTVRYRAEVYKATWGHLAPRKNKTYRGHIVFAFGCFGSDNLNPVVLECEIGLDGSPWFYDALIEFLETFGGDDVTGHLYRWDGTFRNYEFKGSVRRLSLYLPAPPVAEPKAGDVSRETLASSPDAPVVSRS